MVIALPVLKPDQHRLVGYQITEIVTGLGYLQDITGFIWGLIGPLSSSPHACSTKTNKTIEQNWL